MDDSTENEDSSTAKRLAARLLESTGKEGMYYVLRFPTRWRLYSFPWENFGNLEHGDAWSRFAIEDLAEAWVPVLGLSAEHLQQRLQPWSKGFPRGRVERSRPLEYTIYHGNDLGETGLTIRRIEAAFELAACKVAWVLDSQEAHQPEHRAALDEILKR